MEGSRIRYARERDRLRGVEGSRTHAGEQDRLRGVEGSRIRYARERDRQSPVAECSYVDGRNRSWVLGRSWTNTSELGRTKYLSWSRARR